MRRALPAGVRLALQYVGTIRHHHAGMFSADVAPIASCSAFHSSSGTMWGSAPAVAGPSGSAGGFWTALGAGSPARPQRKAEAKLRAADLTTDDVLTALRRMVKSDPRTLFDPTTGNVIPIHKLSADDAWQIAGYEVIPKNAKAGDGITDEVLKIKLKPADRYVELAAKYFGLLEKHEDDDDSEELIALLKSARQRIKKAREAAVDVTGISSTEVRQSLVALRPASGGECVIPSTG